MTTKTKTKTAAEAEAEAEANGMIPSCQLFDLVLDRNWDHVLEHVRCHPQDAAWQDGDCLETPLYLACQLGPPASVIEAFISAYPDATHTQSRQRDVPLHIACRYDASLDVLQRLVTCDPRTTLLQTKFGETPLVALLDGWKSRNGTNSNDNNHDNNNHHDRNNSIAGGTNRSMHEIRDDDWQKILILLRGVARAQNLIIRQTQLTPSDPVDIVAALACGDGSRKHDHEEELAMVHAAVSLGSMGCPSLVLDRILEEFPHQITLAEARHQRLPLHVAIRPTEWSTQLRRRYKPRERYAVQALIGHFPQAAAMAAPLATGSSGSSGTTISHVEQEEDFDSELVTNHHLRSPSKRVAEKGRGCCLGRDHVGACSHQPQPRKPFRRQEQPRRLPLHMAVANGHSWYGGVRAIFQAYPHAGTIVDPATGLLPFQLAAIPVGESQASLDTILELLLAQPHVLLLSSSSSSSSSSSMPQERRGLLSRVMMGFREAVRAKEAALISTSAISSFRRGWGQNDNNTRDHGDANERGTRKHPVTRASPSSSSRTRRRRDQQQRRVPQTQKRPHTAIHTATARRHDSRSSTSWRWWTTTPHFAAGAAITGGVLLAVAAAVVVVGVTTPREGT